MMKYSIIATSFLCYWALALGAASAQTTPQPPVVFEVASIRANNSGGHDSTTYGNLNEIMMSNVSLKRLVEIAYRARDYSFSGPHWLDSAHFDIRAKMPEGATRGQYPLMLRALLIERFKLAAHLESKTISGYALVPAKGGLKLHPTQGEEPSSNSRRGHLDAQGFSMPDTAELLARTLDQPVVDKTGIQGTFNWSLDFGEDDRVPFSVAADAKHAESSGPSLFTALQEQLGLKLMGGEKVSVEIVIVDHIEPVPTDN